jgi:hypothetical protein
MSWDRLAELLPEEALEDALKGLGPNEITGPGGLLTQLAGRVIEIASDAELTEHLGHPPGGRPEGSRSAPDDPSVGQRSWPPQPRAQVRAITARVGARVRLDERRCGRRVGRPSAR